MIAVGIGVYAVAVGLVLWRVWRVLGHHYHYRLALLVVRAVEAQRVRLTEDDSRRFELSVLKLQQLCPRVSYDWICLYVDAAMQEVGCDHGRSETKL